MYLFKKSREELDIPWSLRYKDDVITSSLSIEDASNGGRIEIPYRHLKEFKRFLKAIINKKIEVPPYVQGSERTIQLEFAWSEVHPRKIRNFYSNWIRRSSFPHIIKIIDNVYFGIGKVTLTTNDLEKYNIESLNYIKKRVTNRKHYKQEAGVKYLDI
jgi:hypothetical protein